jgi:hypothetical protein
MSPAEVTEKLGLHRMRDRLWYVHPRYAHSPCLSHVGNWRLSLSSVAPPPARASLRDSNGYPIPSAASHRSRLRVLVSRMDCLTAYPTHVPHVCIASTTLAMACLFSLSIFPFPISTFLSLGLSPCPIFAVYGDWSISAFADCRCLVISLKKSIISFWPPKRVGFYVVNGVRPCFAR